MAFRDIGKAAAIILQAAAVDPQVWHGKTIDCAAWEGDGHDIETHLSSASGVVCKYSPALPRWAMKRKP